MAAIDKSKKSNKRCEHCKFFTGDRKAGKCHFYKDVVIHVMYWNTCSMFKWKD